MGRAPEFFGPQGARQGTRLWVNVSDDCLVRLAPAARGVGRGDARPGGGPVAPKPGAKSVDKWVAGMASVARGALSGPGSVTGELRPMQERGLNRLRAVRIH